MTTWHWKVTWHHDFADEPVAICSEIGEDGYEVRKVEEFRDGMLSWADGEHEHGRTGLAVIPMGRIEDIQAQAEFTASHIPRAEFEAVWHRATDRQARP
ncbi:hypothetical protein GCM10009801_30800 [Streptomyces albiaxialis]|uniref:DUF6881 domain-containing protein n=1 Tax=Streptomyces albiaxialis TaxID=329523 RepID=A0ABN2VY53_9ACTN